MYFGLPCSVTTQRTGIALRIYDVDNQSGGSSWDSSTVMARRYARFLIEQRNMTTGAWSALPAASYTSISGAQNPSNPGNPNSPVTYYNPDYSANRSMIMPNNAGLSNTLVEFTMQPKTQYRVTLGPIWSGTLVGFGLPQENIFGKIDCNVGVQGSVTSNPATGPLSAGTSVTFSPSLTRSGSSLFPSNVSHEMFVWYDTAGNNAYDPGDDRVVNAASCSRAATTPSMTASSLALPACTTTVDTARGGGAAVAICAQLRVTANDAFTRANDSTVICLSIGKSPHLQAANGDVYAGGVLNSAGACTITRSPVISGSSVTIAGSRYSSWATYGVTSLGTSRAFASNNLRAGDPTSASLVFANRLVTNAFGSAHGYFGNLNSNTTGLPDVTRCLNEPFSTFSPQATPTTPTTSINLAPLVGGGGGVVGRSYNIGSGTFTITAPPGWTIPRNTKVIIDVRGANADVKIDSNLIYNNGPYASIDEIPQLVILSGRDITIGSGVSRVDGILGMRRDLITCELPVATTEPRLGVCNTALNINGAVVAGGKVRAFRTYGAEVSVANGTSYDTPAEVFNFAPNVLLKSLPSPGNPDVDVRTVSEKEAPPRF